MTGQSHKIHHIPLCIGEPSIPGSKRESGLEMGEGMEKRGG